MKIIITRDDLKTLMMNPDIQLELDNTVFESIEKAAAKDKAILEAVSGQKPMPAPKKTAGKGAKKIDHGKIVACYKGNRSVSWIADDMKISPQTVINHLKQEGIYKKA